MMATKLVARYNRAGGLRCVTQTSAQERLVCRTYRDAICDYDSPVLILDAVANVPGQ